MKNFTAERINDLKNITTVVIPGLIENGCDINTYMNQGRLVLNVALIEALVGAEFEPKKNKPGEFNAKFCRKLPNKTELAEIASIVDDFIRDVENPFLQTQVEVSEDDDDLEIPSFKIAGFDTRVTHYEKLNQKKLKDHIFGVNGTNAISSSLLDATDVLTIAAMGEEVRKHANRTKIMVIGGIALAVTAIAVGGAIVYTKKKEDEMIDDNGSAPAIDSEIPDTAIDSEIPEDAEVPVVDLE